MQRYDISHYGVSLARAVTRTVMEQLAKDPAHVGAIAIPLQGPELRHEELRADGRWWFIGPPPAYVHFCERLPE